MSGIAAVNDWILRDAPDDVAGIVTGLAERLSQVGIPLQRLATNTMVLHPELDAQTCTWTAGVGIERRPITHEYLRQVVTPLTNPIRDLRDGLFDELRVRLGLDETPYGPIKALAAAGSSDYLLCALPFSDRVRRAYVSFTTNDPRRFSEEAIASLRSLVPALALRIELAASLEATRGLLQVYLGHNAAKRILAGAFRRGTGEVQRAAIWFCDLRGFTALVDRTPVREVVQTLDRYFEAVARPVTEAGGEILKFIGDAMLAIFPAAEDPARACQSALVSAQRALAAVEQVSRERAGAGQETLRIGVALHLGEVMYGNIGASDRLDFTVIGAAVNEVCRVEALCKELGVSILATGAFAEGQGGEGLVSVGRHVLRGVAEPAEIFTLARREPGSDRPAVAAAAAAGSR